MNTNTKLLSAKKTVTTWTVSSYFYFDSLRKLFSFSSRKKKGVSLEEVKQRLEKYPLSDKQKALLFTKTDNLPLGL